MTSKFGMKRAALASTGTMPGSWQARPTSPAHGLRTLWAFFTIWAETAAAYAAYRELSRLSRGDLAARGLRRQDTARHAMGLPLLDRE